MQCFATHISDRKEGLMRKLLFGMAFVLCFSSADAMERRKGGAPCMHGYSVCLKKGCEKKDGQIGLKDGWGMNDDGETFKVGVDGEPVKKGCLDMVREFLGFAKRDSVEDLSGWIWLLDVGDLPEDQKVYIETFIKNKPIPISQ